MKYIVFGKPYINNIQKNEVIDTLRSGWIGSGPKVQKFEEKFRKYKNINYSSAVNSCTAALHLSLNALNLKKDDEVIVPAMTFCSTVNAIIHSGAKPVLADVEYSTGNITSDTIMKKITKKTKAVVIVHLAGNPCNMKEIINVVKTNNLNLIEDCAHAIEGKYEGKHLGTFGDFGCFSFYVTKNITTAEGGMIISNNQKKINKIKVSALHGLSKDAWSRYSDQGYRHYQVTELGFKYNMTDLQASVGIDQLEKVEKYWKKRKKIWEFYHDSLSNLNIELTPKSPNNVKNSYHLFQLKINRLKSGLSRDEMILKLHEKKIGTGVHYLSIPSHIFYKKKYKWKNVNFPNAYKIGKRTLSLPLSPFLKDNEVNYIIEKIKKILS